MRVEGESGWRGGEVERWTEQTRLLTAAQAEVRVGGRATAGTPSSTEQSPRVWGVGRERRQQASPRVRAHGRGGERGGSGSALLCPALPISLGLDDAAHLASRRQRSTQHLFAPSRPEIRQRANISCAQFRSHPWPA